MVPGGDDLVELFDSLFEQHVCRRIQERGYRVLPQDKVAGYRIDLVVEGMRGRMAVECDGERWHGPERDEADMARQRQLERCGWTFWRVRGGAYYRDPDAAMESLWQTLDRLGIHPSSAEVDRPADREPEHDTDVPLEEVRVEEPQSAPTVEVRGPESGSPAFAEAPSPEPVGDGDDVPRPGPDGRIKEVCPFLQPYRPWQTRPLPDPLSAPMTEVMDGLVEIIAAEGPMPCHRAYSLYAEAAGIDGLPLRVRSVFNKEVHQAVLGRRLALRRERDVPGQIDAIVRLAGTPAVVVRERGDRALNEIPPSEIAAALAALGQATGRAFPGEAEGLFRALLRCYGLERSPENDWQTRVLHDALAVAGARPEHAGQDRQLPLLPPDDR
jgi:very-short-patch-repair endonuclease